MSFQIEKWAKGTRDGEDIVIVWCPQCGLRAACDHDVSADGTLHPSLVCPHDGCGFHEWVQLQGWPNEPAK